MKWYVHRYDWPGSSSDMVLRSHYTSLDLCLDAIFVPKGLVSFKIFLTTKFRNNCVEIRAAGEMLRGRGRGTCLRYCSVG